ncbi:hypothetical protein BGZ50_007867 [Haplosporangium sp. Z 11]|nr:hypothetical protein BGZ50_007867 [Haplosporangium sp. Z 11]
MCGFGEKDRRPIDPPPIVQLLMDDLPGYNQVKTSPKSTAFIQTIQPGKGKRRKVAKKNGKNKRGQSVVKQHQRGADLRDNSSDDDDGDDELYRLEGDSEGELNKDGRRKEARAPKQKPPARCQLGNATKSSMLSSTSSKKHSRDADCDFKDTGDQGDIIMDNSHEQENKDHEDWPHYEGGALAMRQDPLFVLHASLWSENGTQVRSMISTPGCANEPPKMTRIMMGAVVVSPMLLNNEMGRPGWYFTFPDLSIRTEGVYSLKFSLMQLDSFECGGNNNNRSNIVAEEMSGPFTVYSAKKFPGMTESTELSKAFAKQGLKIPIRNDLRIRKNAADKDGIAPIDHVH